MKLNKIIAGGFSAAIASAVLATSASAYIAVPSDKVSLLNTSNKSWGMTINSSYDIDYSEVSSIQVLVQLSDESAYLADKEAGYYSDGETAFTDFQGQLAFGGSEWLSFGFTGLTDAAGDSANSAVSALGDGLFSFTANFGADGINNTAKRCAVQFDEWGNTSTDYELEVLSISFYTAEGDCVLSYDEKGQAVIEPAIAETTTAAETTVAETTTEATTTTTEATTTTTEATTTAEETTVAPETETETSAEDTSAEETEASEETEETTTTTTAAVTTTEATTSEETETTTAAATTANVQQAVGNASSTDFTARNNQLMIIAIAAAAVILIAIIGFIVVAARKRK